MSLCIKYIVAFCYLQASDVTLYQTDMTCLKERALVFYHNVNAPHVACSKNHREQKVPHALNSLYYPKSLAREAFSRRVSFNRKYDWSPTNVSVTN